MSRLLFAILFYSTSLFLSVKHGPLAFSMYVAFAFGFWLFVSVILFYIDGSLVVCCCGVVWCGLSCLMGLCIAGGVLWVPWWGSFAFRE